MTLVVNGAVKAAINNTTLEPGVSTQLNFELKQSRASVTVTKGKHWVWIPAFTGSRLPGRWVEVDDSGGWAAAAPADHASYGLVRKKFNGKFTPITQAIDDDATAVVLCQPVSGLENSLLMPAAVSCSEQLVRKATREALETKLPLSSSSRI